MKIAVLGWYGKLNFGDELLQNAISRLFSDSALTFWGNFPNANTLNQFDHIIIGGGSIWPNPFIAQYVKYRRRLLTPFSILGVSARQAVDRSLTELIVADSLQTVVRDHSSKELMFDLEKVKVANDLSWIYPIPINSFSVETKTVGVNLRKWVGTDWNPSGIISSIEKFSTNLIPLPFYYGEKKWGSNELADREVMTLAGLHTSVDVTNIKDFSRIRIMVGMRYHSLVLAAQAGLPFISFNYHPKIVAFAEQMGLSDFCLPLNQPQLIAERINAIEQNYSYYRDQAIRKRNENIELSNQIYPLAKIMIEEELEKNRRSLRNQYKKIKNRIIGYL